MSGIDERLALLERRLRQLESGEAADEGSPHDRVAVLEQLHRLQSAIDARDWDTIRDTFTPDGTGYGRTGVDEILAIMQDHLGGCGPTQHLLGNERLTIEGDRARSLSYARVHHVGAESMQASWPKTVVDCRDKTPRRCMVAPRGMANLMEAGRHAEPYRQDFRVAAEPLTARSGPPPCGGKQPRRGMYGHVDDEPPAYPGPLRLAHDPR
ncbi:nuclear transport factor 2 family protein [Streptomyces sp. NPDC056352]|uniref:nuclear transport factor 2 family protein n=1 Tax=Streptomyces sp. NPDC056352 TaxID=3345791 RepID=UPI0035E20688